MKRGTKIALAITFALIVGGVGYFAIGQPIQVLPRLQTAVPFEMHDQNGDVYRYPDGAGAINVYVVVAAWDEAAVARAERLLESVYARLAAEDALPYARIAWITPDPVNDDLQSIRSLATRLPILKATGASLLMAAPAAVRFAVGAGMGVYVGPQPEPGQRVSYEPTLVLVDDQGWVRGRYGVRSADERSLLRDISLLAAEVKAQGAERALYKAAHLFLCYPR